MKNYCEERVWASGDTDSCGITSVVECFGKALCQRHAKEAYDRIKKEIGLALIGNVIENLRKLKSLVIDSDLLIIEQNIEKLNAVNDKINCLHPKIEIDPPVQDIAYWTKRAQDAEERLKSLQDSNKINICKVCKKEWENM